MMPRKPRGSIVGSRVAAIVALLLAFALAAWGCGGGREAEREREADREPLSDMSSARFRPGVGSVFHYLRSASGPEEMGGVPVNFPLEGDWDFTGEAEGQPQQVTVVDPSSVPGAERFPHADLCLKDETSGETVYRFYEQDERSRRLSGMLIQAEGGRVSWCQYSPALTVLVFPLTAGSEMEEEVTYADSEGYSFSITHRLTVMWVGEMRVPAGDFPQTAMVQDYEISGSEEGYSTRISYGWYAPDVGQVAGVTSMHGESQAAFNRASSFRRLVSFEPAR